MGQCLVISARALGLFCTVDEMMEAARRDRVRSFSEGPPASVVSGEEEEVEPDEEEEDGDDEEEEMMDGELARQNSLRTVS